MIRLGIAGVCGRMGSRVFELAKKDKDFEIRLALEKKGSPFIGKKLDGIEISSHLEGISLIDVLIDFTCPEATESFLDYLARYKKAGVIATTGLNEEQLKKLERAAKLTPIVYAPNFSFGINILFKLVGELARYLGPDYEIEIVEAHHKLKKDAPSGTAKKFAQILKEVTKKEIPTHSIRLGDIVGDHKIIFCGNSERIEIIHRAHSRDLFALGALKAAKWVVNRPAGLYSVKDILKI